MVRVAHVVSGGQQDVADDAVQAARSAAWGKLGSLRDPQRLRQWLVSVAANEARQACLRQRRRTVVEIDMTAIAPAQRDPAERAGELDLESALRHLSPDERALLALRYEAGLDSSEIGASRAPSSATSGSVFRCFSGSFHAGSTPQRLLCRTVTRHAGGVDAQSSNLVVSTVPSQ